MTLMSRKVDYALLILAYLFRKPEGASAREIADCYRLSRAYVANILKDLCGNEFVVSHRGVKGGYALRGGTADCSLADLMDALDDGFHMAECCTMATDEDCCLIPICPIKDAIGTVHHRLRDVLRKVTLGELLGPSSTVRPALQPLNVNRLCWAEATE